MQIWKGRPRGFSYVKVPELNLKTVRNEKIQGKLLVKVQNGIVGKIFKEKIQVMQLKYELQSKLSLRPPGGTPDNSWCGCAALFSKSWPSFRPK